MRLRLSFGLPRSAAQKLFWQTESLQFQAAESRSSDRGPSNHLPCTCSRPRDRKQCWWMDADWWAAPDFDFSYSALHVGQLVDKLGLWSVGQLMVERVAQILLNSIFIPDLDKTEWTACEKWWWVVDLNYSRCTAGCTWLCSWEASLACWVSRVSGSCWYRDVDACFFPASLYLIWTQ